MDISGAIGRYAEYFVCAQLNKMNLEAFHVGRSFDLLLIYEGRPYRIDVKSSDGPRWRVGKNSMRIVNGIRRQTRIRRIEPKDTELLALFHRQTKKVVFRAVLAPTLSVRLSPSEIREAGDGSASLRKAILALNQQHNMPENNDKFSSLSPHLLHKYFSYSGYPIPTRSTDK